ncbi:hypothetical protein [Dyadobacter chenhuakuii]|uniref:Uncharacterized protein n=1 Tax=Dyadobacter chenhuakuii TaxID=2909339 RepID=A0ABY4XRS7_9BACT|nr:hypothetical protein [Dyadobacter chenhuakuii]MCF2492706.1 hypothetical protein [Dyadobacter chenhuakuii]USJ33003.1 hypothetical protein NFI80_09670 [Dyadobacter chenhuakuii]
MEALNILSSIVIITAVGAVVYKTAKLFYKLITNADLTVTNKRTGKSIKMGAHPTPGFAEKLLDVLNS